MLTERVAFISGGTGALGSAVAERLSAEGSLVYVSYLQEKELLQLPAVLQRSVKPFKADMTNESQVNELYESILTNSSRIEIVINAVGGFLPRKSLTEVSVEEWDRMMNINLKSTFLSTREALRRMVGQSYGRIINISAMIGVRPLPERIPYAISKASVSLLTELVAQEVKGTGITVNAIAPSIIATPANVTSMAGEDTSQWVTPGQIADIISYLCSPAAAAITGTTIRASGGL